MRYETSSSKDALIFNGKGQHIVNPWHIIIDTDEQTITIRKRNWHLIGSDEQTLAFNRVRSISIDEHLVGADIHIKVVGGMASIFCLSKGDARKTREILLEFNANSTGTTINLV